MDDFLDVFEEFCTGLETAMDTFSAALDDLDPVVERMDAAWSREPSILDGMIHTPIPTMNLPILSRKEEEEYRAERRKSQHDRELFCREINEDLGEAVSMVHELGNAIEDTAWRIADDIANVGEAVNPAMLLSELFLGNATPEKGDHLYVLRAGYTHHGVYVGDGNVVHYLLNGVQSDSLDIFRDGATIRIMEESKSPAHYEADEICNRAYSRICEGAYNLVFNNCEHFARWCRCGE